jgi:hypothetical protein
LRPSSSSSSLIGGYACENSDTVRCEIGGDEDGEEVGDGGPNVDGDTNACGGADDIGVAGAKFIRWLVGEGSPSKLLRLCRIVSGDFGGVGTLEFKKRFVVLTLSPAFCSESIRSAIEPPAVVIKAGSVFVLSVL